MPRKPVVPRAPRRLTEAHVRKHLRLDRKVPVGILPYLDGVRYVVTWMYPTYEVSFNIQTCEPGGFRYIRMPPFGAVCAAPRRVRGA
jgi:hypothetical protein